MWCAINCKYIEIRKKQMEQQLIAGIGIVGELTFDVCECSGDEEDLLITAEDLVCQNCGQHQPFFIYG